MPCIIKRTFDNYKAADAELNAMLQLPDTENEGNVNVRRPDNEDFNKIVKQLVGIDTQLTLKYLCKTSHVTSCSSDRETLFSSNNDFACVVWHEMALRDLYCR